MRRQDFQQLEVNLFGIPKSFRADMRVPARFYADQELLVLSMDDACLDQLVNTATLPGAYRWALAMPDIHQGYGFPIGGVLATLCPDGVISPGGVGYDINCGIRLLGTHVHRDEVASHLDSLASALHANCPSGLGKGGSTCLRTGDLDRILVTGSQWALKRGYATESDLDRTEENGCLEGADAGKVSQRAKERGQNQVGTLGSGNHFIEVDAVERIEDEPAARRLGLFPGQILVQLHCGSRGLGHQVCSDYVKDFQTAVHKFGIALPDRELVCAPLSSREGQAYLAAMKAAANYAFANRQVLTWHVRNSFEQVLAASVKNPTVFQVYDVAHNMAKIEDHRSGAGNSLVKLCVHRKGATRAFGPGHPAVPASFRDVGQPVLVPGSMGTASWVLVGTGVAMEKTFGSTCHGAGRAMSRSKAKKSVRGADLRERMESSGILVRVSSLSELAEEAPSAYKDVDRVVSVVHEAGLARKVARLVPLVVVKG